MIRLRTVLSDPLWKMRCFGPRSRAVGRLAVNTLMSRWCCMPRTCWCVKIWPLRQTRGRCWGTGHILTSPVSGMTGAMNRSLELRTDLVIFIVVKWSHKSLLAYGFVNKITMKTVKQDLVEPRHTQPPIIHWDGQPPGYGARSGQISSNVLRMTLHAVLVWSWQSAI